MISETLLLSIALTGFAVAFLHAAIPTHWLPFVLASRGQRWGKAKTLMVVALCGSGHVLFTAVLGALVVWLGIELSSWTGAVFPWIAGSALILVGLYYLLRQVRGDGHGHQHFGAGHGHAVDHAHHHHHHGDHDHAGAVEAETAKSDRAIILGLFTLLTFSPCEGFLPVYLSGISYGWIGFIALSAILALATVAGMVVFTWLTLSGMERLRLGFVERHEAGFLGALILFLGVGIMLFGF